MLTIERAKEELRIAARRNPGPWEQHSLVTADNARRIAEKVPGMDPEKAVTFALLLNIPLNAGLAIMDLIELLSGGAGSLAFRTLLFALFGGCAAFAGILIAVRLLKKIVSSFGFSVFGFYSWGAALLTFLIYLTAA